MRYAVALAVSIGLHVVGFGLVRAFGVDRMIGQAVRAAPARETIDFAVAGGGERARAAPVLKAEGVRPRHLPRAAGEAGRGVNALGVPPPQPSPVQGTGEGEQLHSLEGDGRVSDRPLLREGEDSKGALEASAVAAAEPALDLRPFFQRLQASAKRCAGARRGGAKVRFCVDPAGMPTDVSLAQSSGNFALDDAALHCVIPGAAPLPLTDRCLVVPLVFR